MVNIWLLYSDIWFMMVNINLVGGFNPSEKYENKFGMMIPNIWKNKACSKPSTSWYILYVCMYVRMYVCMYMYYLLFIYIYINKYHL